MSTLDWIISIGTILFIVLYGIWKTRKSQDIQGYLRGGNSLKWWTIGLSIMATQASAITFLSTPGQAFDDGMRFVQFYFGVPIAMVIISIVAIPIYRKLNVFTAYEYLEQRFDFKTRTLGAILFLISRGLAAGITIYAPAIILSLLLGWPLDQTIIGIGLIVMVYTVLGGTKAVSVTQQQQMAVILVGMLLAGIVMVLKLPQEVSFGDAVFLAGKMGKLNAITIPSAEDFDLKDKYNIWAGLIGGTFLALSYFGTDQSQVQRYLGGKSVSEIRLGLMFNAIFKVPMQFLILFIGVMMFVFYQFNSAPLFFNQPETEAVIQSEWGPAYQDLEQKHAAASEAQQATMLQLIEARHDDNASQMELHQMELTEQLAAKKELRKSAKELIEKNNPEADLNDLDQIFLTFVLGYLPQGLIGLVIAVILSAAMSSTSAELNALATTSVIDVYKRSFKPGESEEHYVNASKVLTLAWGVFAILFALTAHQLGNLIQAVNLIGSLFYGTILGIFVVAFFMKSVQGTAVFWAAILGECVVLACYLLPLSFEDTFAWLDIGFLWYNLIGCVAVMIFAAISQMFQRA
ncbi:sodium:solute symporter [Pontibacter sp. G13]|uniref:sodium:solute symporter n=1 Tax=Pontibacter sp. G13 TaxID=3074898 RepID=UPI00288B5545|nr:sodium:solute symporter [Pontibacter sp. G13]WNJ18591.1 sodium:solute symporter [Pontibacter sp. G13]